MRRILGILIMMIISVTTAMSQQMSIAHELGHGTNSLHHTFSPESETFYTTKETDNLMDYHAGKTLTHTQWQWSHEKHRNVLGFLDDEGEGENISLTGRFYAILNGNKDYKLYDKSSITVLGGTEPSFDVLPDDFVYNQVHDYLKSKLNEDSLLSFKIKLNKTIELKNEKSEVVNFSRLPIGSYTCSIQINIDSLYGLVIHNDVKSAFKLPFKRYAYNFSINVEVVEKPIARLEPADRENFFLKFGYDDALVKENQDRGDYPQEIIAGQVYYVPWLHIQPNVEAEMKLDFKFDETFVSKLTSIIGAKQDKEYTLSFIVKGDNGIKINGKDSVEVPIDEIDEILKMSCSAERNGFVSIYAKNFITGESELAGKLEVECRPMKTIGTIKVYSAKRYDEDKYPTINQDEILEFVNKYYVQAGVRFDLDSTAVALFEIKTKSIKEVLNIEQDFINETIRKKDKNNPIPYFRENGISKLYLLTDNHITNKLGGHTNGQSAQGYGWTYVLLENKNYIVIVHELGHVLGLPHTFIQDRKDNLSNTINKNSTINVMDYESAYTNHRKLFYKYQINHIYKTHKSHNASK